MEFSSIRNLALMVIELFGKVSYSGFRCTPGTPLDPHLYLLKDCSNRYE